MSTPNVSNPDVSNPDKVFFPDVGLTKRDIVDYYARIADHMLPFVAGRPLVLERFPDGLGGEGFYQKNVPSHVAESIERVEIAKVGGGTTTYAVVHDVADVVRLADQAALVWHTLLADADSPDRPVEVVFDLDPSGDDTAPIRRTARALHELLDELDLAPRVKSSGSRGLHVVVDVTDDDADFDLAKEFANAVAARVVEQCEDVTTEQRKDRRRGRLFLDTLRNSPANHAVAPYSVRAIPGAPVAAPLDWDEALSTNFDPQRITVANVFRRLGQRDDPWSDRDRPAATIADALARLEES